MDTTQLVIIISIISITLVVVVCGIWLVLILKELKTTLVKVNHIVDDASSITSSITQPLASLSEFILGLKNGITVFNRFFPSKPEPPPVETKPDRRPPRQFVRPKK